MSILVERTTVIKDKNLTELEVWLIVKEWYTQGNFYDTLRCEAGFDLEETCYENIALLSKK